MILWIKITTYNYTTGNSLTGGVTKTYAYDSSKRLISVTENGVTQSISGYDALGNPASYKGNTLTWTRGRMLASCGNNSYLYDMDGVRQEKTVNGVTHTYYTDGTKILAEKVGDKVFEYYYDAQGIVGFKYDGAVYYFKKNLMGDIDRIYDANKNLVAEYKYDAWGNHRVYTGTGIDITDNSSYNNSVAKLNPFRYRGYYYDTETGLYYLNSRYYDPSVGRFINADDISYIQPTEINGLNLFAYCGNNPVMYVDPDGTWSWSSFWRGVINVLTGVGAIVAGALVFASGVAGIGMMIVAGVTIASGVLTTINGGADIGEAISGYNFVRDGIFGSNQSAYDLYAGITAGIAAVGSAICGGWLRYNAPRINAYKNIEAYQYSNTLMDSKHMARSYQHSVLLQKQIIKYGKMVKESKQIVNFTIKGGFRIGEGVWHDATWKLVVNYIKGIIFHIGPF